MITARLEAALKIVQRAGTFLMENRHALRDITAKEAPTDFVTNLDREVQDQVFLELSRHFPEDGCWGEESETDIGEKLDRIWILDPIDGTTNYIYDLPAYAVSLAYFSENRPVLGIVHLPVLQETYWAVSGQGAFRNGTPLKVSAVDQIADALIATGYPYHPDRRIQEMKLYHTLIPLCRDIRALGSAAVGLIYVACGRCDAFFEPELKFYDIAAGMLILEEAGGISTGLKGEPWDFRNTTLLSASPRLHEKMVQVIRSISSDPSPGH